MSIYATNVIVGEDCDFNHDKSVLSGVQSHQYPDPDKFKPGHIGIDTIPSWCTPGMAENAPEDYFGGDWVRLWVASWNEEYNRPMTSDKATVVLDEFAVKVLVSSLQEWLDHKEKQ